MARPNPLLWIWYTLGGKLGSPYREWVLHDTTRRTRWLRQILSFMDLIVLPTAVVLAVLGVSGIVWAGVGLGLLLALGYSLAYINSTAERPGRRRSARDLVLAGVAVSGYKQLAVR
jgi:hypothetical protein